MSYETGSLPRRAARRPVLRRYGRKLMVVACWFCLIAGYQSYAWWDGIPLTESLRYLTSFLSTSPLGPLVYVGFYAADRLVFLPPTLLAISAGTVFGPVLGVVLALLGANIAASISYVMGRYFGGGLLESDKASSVARRYAGRMRESGFEAVLLMRLLYTPFDVVSILAGFLRIGWRPFALATALGSVPCTISLVLFGASLDAGFGGTPAIEPWALLASAVLFGVSISMSRLWRRGTVRGAGTW